MFHQTKRKGKPMTEQENTQSAASMPEQAAEQPEQAQEAPQEPVVAPVAETDELQKALEDIKQELAQSAQKCDEYLDMAQRARADFENYRRRNQSVRAEAFEDGAREFIKTLLPVVDNLERALEAQTEETALGEGVKLVYKQLCDTLQKRGVTVIDRKGQPFDPMLENAVMQGTAEDGEPGTVCAVLQKGYQLGNTVLRHAMVKVVEA